MLSTVHLMNISLPILYIFTFGAYWYDFTHEKKNLSNSKRIFLFVTVVIHVFYLIVRTIEFNHTPITSKFEIFTVLAFCIAFSYFILELLTDIRGTGLFIILFSLIFQILSSIFIEDLLEVNELLRNRLLGLHVISAICGYTGITISAVYGVLFIILYKSLKLSKFGLIFKRLPSLETLEKLSFYSLVIGFIFLTIAIIIGSIWLPAAFPNFSFLDPKLISTGIVWIIYGAGIVAKLAASWYGKKVITFSLVGFIMAIISLILGQFLQNSFHMFT
ncbi:MAG: cytochrome c biogenesis protein [Bacteroidetes bacterium]|nr:cytochrome c biogenesis protein [Bacteroidota bacterium]